MCTITNHWETGSSRKEGCIERIPLSTNIKINCSCLPIYHNRNQVTTRYCNDGIKALLSKHYQSMNKIQLKNKDRILKAFSKCKHFATVKSFYQKLVYNLNEQEKPPSQ